MKKSMLTLNDVIKYTSITYVIDEDEINMYQVKCTRDKGIGHQGGNERTSSNIMVMMRKVIMRMNIHLM